MSGPLTGLTVVELAGIGPGPFAGMLLSDMGATVIRVERAQEVRGGDPAAPPKDILRRGRQSIGVDLKNPAGVEVVLRLVEKADALFEGFRPGVTERLGLGPDVCLARNPRLVYGRMTGWGQTGPYALAAGHDINYIALAGALAHFGRAGGKPTPPINLVGDFGGGGMFMAFGVVCGILEAQRSGKGQVLDVAMVDGSAILMTMMWGLKQIGFWDEAMGENLLDTGAPFYDTYETKDGKFISLGSLEPQFYAELIQKLGLEGEGLPGQMDRNEWGTLRTRFTELFKTKTRDEWDAVLAKLTFRRVEGGHGEAQAGEEGHAEVHRPASAVDEDTDADYLRAPFQHSADHLADAAAGGEHIIHDEHLVARAHLEAAAELALVLRAVLTFGDDAWQSKVAGGFVGKDDPPGSRARNHGRLAPEVLSDLAAEFLGQVGPLKDAEFLDVGIAVASAGELEVPAKHRAAGLQLFFELDGHDHRAYRRRGPRSTGR